MQMYSFALIVMCLAISIPGSYAPPKLGDIWSNLGGYSGTSPSPTPAPAGPTTPKPTTVPPSDEIPCLNIISQWQCFSNTTCYYWNGVCLPRSIFPTAQPTTAPRPPRNETSVKPAVALNTTRGKEIGSVFQAFLSPQQEGGEEEDTPPGTPSQFKSTAPSVPRNLRRSRGHGLLQFTKDLSKAYAYLAIENVNPSDIVMLHLHCGRPGQLGPIIIDFGLIGNITESFKDGVLAFETFNEDIMDVVKSGEGFLGLLTAGCPIVQTIPTDKVKTIAGMELIARSGELYWNLHTKGQTYYGDMRGQLHAVNL